MGYDELVRVKATEGWYSGVDDWGRRHEFLSPWRGQYRSVDFDKRRINRRVINAKIEIFVIILIGGDNS